MIEHVCSDGDARGCDGVNEAMQLKNRLWETLRQCDTTHLGVSQYKKALKCNFSENFFPDFLSTKEQRDDLQKVLSQDIKARCHIVFNNIHNECTGDITKMASCMTYIIFALVKCYNGDHKLCVKKSEILGCKGGKVNNWFLRSIFFTTLPYKIKQFTMNRSDRKLFKEILSMKLGIESLSKLKLNLNTNANEAANRGFSVNLPKNVNFSRNYYGRAHSSAHRMNHKVGESMFLKLEHMGAKIPKGSRVARAITQFQTESQYQASYKKSKRVKMRINAQKRDQHFKYQQVRKNRKAADMYKKGMLDSPPKEDTRSHRKPRFDHFYSKFEWTK